MITDDLLFFVDVQAEKDAKRKARAKELKKLRKAREKRAAQVGIILSWFWYFLKDAREDIFHPLMFMLLSVDWIFKNWCSSVVLLNINW